MIITAKRKLRKALFIPICADMDKTITDPDLQVAYLHFPASCRGKLNMFVADGLVIHTGNWFLPGSRVILFRGCLSLLTGIISSWYTAIVSARNKIMD